MAKSSDIVGYTFQSELYCPEHIVAAVTATPEFEGWGLAAGVDMPVEANLSEIAAHFQIDRMDESSFDSAEFPKVVFRDQADGSTCDTCGEPLG